MYPYVNIVDGKLERLYVEPCGGKLDGKLTVVYRPTHHFMGCYTVKEVVAMWNMTTKQFYRMVSEDTWFRLPKNGTYDFMVANYYSECEEAYKNRFLTFTEAFVKKHRLKRLYEEVPYDYLRMIKRERKTLGGKFITCKFDETQNFEVSGPKAEFAEEFFTVIATFEGHTKVELYKQMDHLVTVPLFVEILRTFRAAGINGIAELKCLSRKEIAKIMVHSMNRWRFS